MPVKKESVKRRQGRVDRISAKLDPVRNPNFASHPVAKSLMAGTRSLYVPSAEKARIAQRAGARKNPNKGGKKGPRGLVKK